MDSILAAVEQIACKHPDRTAYRVDDMTLTYHELWHFSDCVAHSISKRGLQRQQPIIVYGHMSPFQIVAFLGAVKAGHPYIPVDKSIPPERLHHIIEASNTKLLLSTEPLHTKVCIPVIPVNDLIAQPSSETLEPSSWVRDEEIHYIIYTSGSTGQPKGVQITADNLANFVIWMHEHFTFQESSVFLNQAPYSFDLSVMDLYPALVGGHTLHAISQEQIANPKTLFDSLAASKTSIWTSTPSFAKMCLMNKAWNHELMPALTTFLFCGEVLPPAVAKEIMQRFPHASIYNLYGPTETTVAVSFVQVTEELLAQFEQLPIATVSNQNISLWEDGEIVISGPTVSAGYLNTPGLTAKTFQSQGGKLIYKTGDVGYEKDGFLFFSGRKDYQIKLHGYRVEIEEIEKQIGNLPLVDDCVVIPIEKDDEIVSLSSYIVLHEPLTDSAFKMTKQLKASLSDYLPSYMIPKSFKYMETLPLNPNGKIDRNRLAAWGTV